MASSEPAPVTTAKGPLLRLQALLRRAGDAAVRYSIRLSPSEAQRTLGVTFVAGAACGILAVMFHTAILAADRRLISAAQSASGWSWIPWTLAVPTLGGLIAGLALSFAFPAARGSGIPQVKAAYAVQTERVRLRDGAAKFVITALQVGAGASLGREGPTVHMCAALSCAIGRWFALAPRSVRRLLPEYELVCVESAKKALALLDAGRPFDLIVSDVMMPEMSGIDFYEELCARYPDEARRVVFVTGGALGHHVGSFLGSVPNMRLEKPFAAADLRRVIEQALV